MTSAPPCPGRASISASASSGAAGGTGGYRSAVVCYSAGPDGEIDTGLYYVQGGSFDYGGIALHYLDTGSIAFSQPQSSESLMVPSLIVR